jgi:MFS family permease
MQAIWIGIIHVIFTLVAMAVIDKLGRKPLLVVGLVAVVISMRVCAYGFKQASCQLTAKSVLEMSGQLDTEKLTAPISGNLPQ